MGSAFKVGDRVIEVTGWRRGSVTALFKTAAKDINSKVGIRWDKPNRNGLMDVMVYCSQVQLASAPLSKWQRENLKGRIVKKVGCPDHLTPAIKWASLGAEVEFDVPIVYPRRADGYR